MAIVKDLRTRLMLKSSLYPRFVVATRVLATFALLAAPALAAAQSQEPPLPAYRARLLGVFNAQTGDPIEGAEVTDALSKTKALTTATGTVTLSFLPEGGSMVRVTKIGFAPEATIVTISPSDTTPFMVMMKPVSQTLPTVVTKDEATSYVSAGLRGFEERRRSGSGGRFITTEELRKNETKNMTYMVRRLPGVQIHCPRPSSGDVRVGQCWAYSGRATSKFAFGGQQCVMDVYIDGQITGDNDLEKMRVDQYAGIEFYSGASSIPMQYNKTGSTCGVLLFWSRER